VIIFYNLACFAITYSILSYFHIRAHLLFSWTIDCCLLSMKQSVELGANKPRRKVNTFTGADQWLRTEFFLILVIRWAHHKACLNRLNSIFAALFPWFEDRQSCTKSRYKCFLKWSKNTVWGNILCKFYLFVYKYYVFLIVMYSMSSILDHSSLDKINWC